MAYKAALFANLREAEEYRNFQPTPSPTKLIWRNKFAPDFPPLPAFAVAYRPFLRLYPRGGFAIALLTFISHQCSQLGEGERAKPKHPLASFPNSFTSFLSVRSFLISRSACLPTRNRRGPLPNKLFLMEPKSRSSFAQTKYAVWNDENSPGP